MDLCGPTESEVSDKAALTPFAHGRRALVWSWAANYSVFSWEAMGAEQAVLACEFELL